MLGHLRARGFETVQAAGCDVAAEIREQLGHLPESAGARESQRSACPASIAGIPPERTEEPQDSIQRLRV